MLKMQWMTATYMQNWVKSNIHKCIRLVCLVTHSVHAGQDVVIAYISELSSWQYITSGQGSIRLYHGLILKQYRMSKSAVEWYWIAGYYSQAGTHDCECDIVLIPQFYRLTDISDKIWPNMWFIFAPSNKK